MSAETILSRVHDNARVRPNAIAYHIKKDGQWVGTTWREYTDEIRQTARALIAFGMKPGDTASILGFNHPEWVIFDLACMLVGGVPAGIYTTNAPNEVHYIIDHAESRIALVEDKSQWEKINQERERLPNLSRVVAMKVSEKIDDPLVLDWETFLEQGNDISDEVVDERMANLKPDDPATLIYTSGTTGPPKAVILTHHNLLWTAQQAGDLFGIGEEDSSLSYLPLSHIAEQMFTIHGAICHSYQVFYAESIRKMLDNLKEVQPTILFGVPRIWEKIYAGVTSKLKETTGIKAKLMDWAMDVGKQVITLTNQGKKPNVFLAWQHKLADKLVYSKIKPLIGLSRAYVCITSAAPISHEILDFLAGIDVILHESYGQSETCGATTFNYTRHNKVGSVGLPLGNTKIKIADDGEILVRSSVVFKGYYKEDEATRKVLHDDWFYSEDLGELDADGYLTITGRKKDIMITSGGKNIAPQNIELALAQLELIAQAILIGEGQKFVSALLTLDEDAVKKFAQKHGISVDESIHDNALIKETIEKEIADKVNSQFARVEHVRKFHILPHDFSIEGGELTPTLKIKRQIVTEKYAAEIAAIYS